MCVCVCVCVCDAVMHDHVSGLKKRPRAPGQHLTGSLWVRHPSGHQGLQVTRRMTSICMWMYRVHTCHTCLIPPPRVSSALLSTIGGLWLIWQTCWITANSSSLTICSKNSHTLIISRKQYNTLNWSFTMSFWRTCVFSFGSNLREFLLLEYASGLFTHHRYVYPTLSKQSVFTPLKPCERLFMSFLATIRVPFFTGQNHFESFDPILVDGSQLKCSVHNVHPPAGQAVGSIPAMGTVSCLSVHCADIQPCTSIAQFMLDVTLQYIQYAEVIWPLFRIVLWSVLKCNIKHL